MKNFIHICSTLRDSSTRPGHNCLKSKYFDPGERVAAPLRGMTREELVVGDYAERARRGFRHHEPLQHNPRRQAGAASKTREVEWGPFATSASEKALESKVSH